MYLKKVNYSVVYGKHESLIVFDENNNEIFNRAISEGGRGLALDKSCPNYSKFSKEEGVAEVLVYVLEDSIYYLEDNGSCDDTIIPEYKAALKDNGVLLEKVGDCKVSPEGSCQ